MKIKDKVKEELWSCLVINYPMLLSFKNVDNHWHF